MKLVITDNLTSTNVSIQVGSLIHPDITNVLSKSRGPELSAQLLYAEALWVDGPLGGVLAQGQMVQKDLQGNSS